MKAAAQKNHREVAPDGLRSAIYVNIGCGAIHHPRWLNLDVEPTDAAVTALDVRAGIPLSDGVASACFSSHVIEHLSPAVAVEFLREQHRVLRKCGIIRVVCPDLAEIARAYLASYERATTRSEPSFAHQHLIMELVDQLVRSEPGGELAKLWARALPADREWVAQRIGYVSVVDQNRSDSSRSWAKRVVSALRDRPARRRCWRRLRDMFHVGVAHVCGGSRLARIVKQGIFRDGGEVHLWMYDHITLSSALMAAGFTSPTRRLLGESDIPQWADFNLEFRDGVALKPHSLVVEAVKP